MSVAEQWASYRELVLHHEAPPEQVRCTQMAFYAGAHLILGHLTNAVSQGADVTDEDVAALGAIVKELEAFVSQVAEEAPPAEAAPAKPPISDYRVPVPDHVREKLNVFGRRIKNECPKGWGFALLMFEYGGGGSMVWLSSAAREDMLKALQEFLQKQGS
jgi:hypothetical protein